MSASSRLKESKFFHTINEKKSKILRWILSGSLAFAFLGACNDIPTPDPNGTRTPIATMEFPTSTPEATATPDTDPWPQEGGPWRNCEIDLNNITPINDDFSVGSYRETQNSPYEQFSFYDPDGVNTTLLEEIDMSPGTSEIFMCTFIEKYGQKFLAAVSMFGVDENGNLIEIARKLTIDYGVLNDAANRGNKTVRLGSSKNPRKNYLV